MLLMNTGIGMYVRYSEYINGMAVKNNSLIVQKQSSCRYCKVDIYCYSNSSSQNVGYYLSPNGGRVYSNSDYYDYTIQRTGYGGVRMHNYYDYTPDIWGIFTCQLPDSEGNTLETSIGIYSSMPSTFLELLLWACFKKYISRSCISVQC